MFARPVLGAALALTLAFFGVSPLPSRQDARAEARPPRIAAPAFGDTELSDMLTTLDSTLGTNRGSDRWLSNAKNALWNFTRQIQAGAMTAAQETTVLGHLQQISRQYPETNTIAAQAHRIISKFTVGKTAPEIIGKDLEGKTMRLSDYRGRVVVLSFSGHWCGICRTAYPYERTLLERYGSSGFALLGVNSDADRTVARQTYLDNGLDFRAWWDGPRAGQIATAWEITGWPTVYILDPQGVIRFVDLKQDELVNGVSELVAEAAATTR
jgi:peroxiredoxin